VSKLSKVKVATKAVSRRLLAITDQLSGDLLAPQHPKMRLISAG
jgi:hypothetical protein